MTSQTAFGKGGFEIDAIQENHSEWTIVSSLVRKPSSIIGRLIVIVGATQNKDNFMSDIDAEDQNITAGNPPCIEHFATESGELFYDADQESSCNVVAKDNVLVVNLCYEKSYLAVKDSVGDPLFVDKLQFFSFVSNIVESFLKKYQTDQQMIPFLYCDLKCIVIGHNSKA